MFSFPSSKAKLIGDFSISRHKHSDLFAVLHFVELILFSPMQRDIEKAIKMEMGEKEKGEGMEIERQRNVRKNER